MAIEEEKQSQYSPGPVLSEESLLRIVYYPAHIDDDGQLKPEAIPTQDLNDRGFSVYRRLYVKREKLSNVINSYVGKKPERECRGISPILCQTVRTISDRKAKKAFNVLDDATTKDDEAHAEIKFTRKYGRAEQKSLRNKLKDKFTAILDVETICSELQDTDLHNNKSWLKTITFFFYYWLAKFTGK